MSEENDSESLLIKSNHTVKDEFHDISLTKHAENGMTGKEGTNDDQLIGACDNNNILQNGSLASSPVFTQENNIANSMTDNSKVSTKICSDELENETKGQPASGISLDQNIYNQNSSSSDENLTELAKNIEHKISNSDQNFETKSEVKPKEKEPPMTDIPTQYMSANQVPYAESIPILSSTNSASISLEELTDKLLSETSEPSSPDLRSRPIQSSASSSQSSAINSPALKPRTNHLGTPNGISGSILNHPAYKTAMQDILSLREQMGELKSQIDSLEHEKQRLEADRSPAIWQLQLETLERTVGQQAQEIEAVKLEASKQEEAAIAALASSKIQLDRLKKSYAEADREREATVVRYAVSEREREKGKADLQIVEKKLLEAQREKDALLSKLKIAAADKARACQALDNKCAEMSAQTREFERLKDELNSRDVKIKWAQNKARTEIESHKETQLKLERLTVKLQEARDETEQVRRETQAIVKSCQQGKEDRTQALELTVQEQKAQLITERHSRQDAEDNRRAAVAEAELARARQQQLLDENNALSLRVQQLEQERLETEQRLSSFQSSEERRCQLEADVEALALQLQQQEERSDASKSEVERLRQNSADLAQDAQSCREREAELLAYTQKLTDKVVRLQSESSALQARAQQVESEREPLTRQVADLTSQVNALQAELGQEKAARLEESQLLARRLAEKQEWGERLSRQLEEAQGECAVLKRKQAQATKELTREVQQCRRKLQQAESNCGTTLSQNSRSGSLSSINSSSEPNQAPAPKVDTFGLDPQLLITHIGKLQREQQRQQEKVEFLEEHSRTLLAELQRKARLIQGLVLKEEAGALSSRASDRSKAELSRHGGVMASLYTAAPTDDSMTLELSLEINRKLQAVLEDTLLKNITLKDNMDTLGREIERLSAQLVASKKSKGNPH